ncbi:aldehyde dehydrogenase family protein [Oricola sp.]|uniref:aldehyde dehydrogenase family protein n=1 Tax=Oricola sp. TaxID=1979950 RepID=UPI0025DB6B68|nr:aldehyde dehydrogenase family protein [Oricola sp.]MCI5075389.1 aldehyde dehydrogenase family protein [Oricola sp.]
MSRVEQGCTKVIHPLIGGQREEGREFVPVLNPYDGAEVASMPVSSEDDARRAIEKADAARAAMAAMPARERAAYLRRVADLVTERTEDIAVAMTQETGKALRDARVETARSADTLRLCAEEAIRIEGAHIPMEASAIGAGKIAMTLRFPVGVVSAITPFNAPVNLVMHKLGPSIAAGNATVLKCSPKAPLCVSKAVECFLDAGGLPGGALSALYGDAVGPVMVSDPRVDFISFTGSTRVGKIIRQNAGMKRVALELGGVGPTIVHSDADIEVAAPACARNAFMLAGQSCISVQNVFVHRSIHDAFVARLLAEIETLRVGDPMNPATEIGTLIDEEAALRVEAMLDRAVSAGAELLAGGSRTGAQIQPAVLHKVTQEMDVACEEIFGPAMSVIPYDDVEQIFRDITASRYGLQAGIFTQSLPLALAAIKGIRTGGVIVNGTSRWRSDQMPYGGVKDSGIGREGPKFSTLDMTEERFFVLN